MNQILLEKLFYIFYCFILSYIFIPLSFTDDQNLYISFYYSVEGKNLSEIISIANQTLGSFELGYPFFVWISVKFLSKNTFVLIINVTLSYLLITILLREKVDKLNVFLIITGFYYFVLMFSLERLKLSFFFLLLAYFINKKYLLKIVFNTFAMLTHFQVFPLAILGILNSLKKLNIIILLLYFFLLQIFFYSNYSHYFFSYVFEIYDYILAKLSIYKTNNILNDLIQYLKFFILFFIGYLNIKKNKLNFNISFLILFILINLTNAGRLIILVYTALTFFLVIENRTHSKLFTLMNIYFFIKGVIFLTNIYLYGNGYANIAPS